MESTDIASVICVVKRGNEFINKRELTFAAGTKLDELRSMFEMEGAVLMEINRLDAKTPLTIAGASPLVGGKQ